MFGSRIIDYASNLDEKISNPPKLRSLNCFCMWSDLLGFGKMFEDSNWELSSKQKRKIYNRLESAHSKVLYYSSPFEHDLILNDGIAKVFHPPKILWKKDVSLINIFSRSCVQLHMEINKDEHKHNLPGCRSVIAFGESIKYLSEEVRYDDYVFNYTKPKGEEISSLAKQNGNPIIIYNPKELQMNTAFSKSYILEAGGSRIGLSGNHLFVDQSVIDALLIYSKDKGYYPILKGDDKTSTLFFSYEKQLTDYVWMGLTLGKPITPDPQIARYKTTVYQLLRFYPHDEKISEFYFDLEEM